MLDISCLDHSALVHNQVPQVKDADGLVRRTVDFAVACKPPVHLYDNERERLKSEGGTRNTASPER